MIEFLFALLSMFTTAEEREAAKSNYRGNTVYDRSYITNFPGIKGVADWRFYIDSTPGALTMLHEEGWYFGLGYQRGIYWGHIKGRFHFFVYDHTEKWDGIEFEIRRGIEP